VYAQGTSGPFGLAFQGGYLYVGFNKSISRYKYTTGDTAPKGAPEKLVDLPTGGHNARNVIFNRAGTKMYVSIVRREISKRTAIPCARQLMNLIRMGPAGGFMLQGFAILWGCSLSRNRYVMDNRQRAR